MSESTDGGSAGETAHQWHPALRPNSIAEVEEHSAIPQNASAQTNSATSSGAKDVIENSEDTDPAQHEADLEEPEASISTADRFEPDERSIEKEGGDISSDAKADSSPQDDLNAAWATEPSATLQHSNSFPAVPPFDQQQSSLSGPALPQTQAESVLVEALQEDEVAQNDSWGPSSESFFNQPDTKHDGLDMQTTETVEPSDAEARYEEGLPLVPKEDEVAPADVNGETAASGDGFDAFGDDATEDDFFRTVRSQNEGKAEPQPGHLPRKSTEQVLSLANGLAQTDSNLAHADNITPDNISKITGGGIAVSTTTVVSQVLSEHLEELKEGSAGTSEVKEEDLNALWQAALGDDELLDGDDELLDDDAAIDPSSFFEDDGEGFLTEPALEEAISPPVPTPVHDGSGQLKGFSHPTTRQVSQQYIPTATQPASQAQRPFGQQIVQPMAPYSQYGRQAAIPGPDPGTKTSGPQSFADKAKGGYTSPFDAPMDLSRPKRKSTQQGQTFAAMQGAQNTPPPPPRSSSMAPPSSVNAAYPQAGSQSGSAPISSSTQPSEVRPQSKSSSSSFFEDLPIAPKVRPPSVSARSPSSFQPVLPPLDRNIQRSPPKPLPQSQDFGLVAPQRQMSFGEAAQQSTPQNPYTQPAQPSKTAPPVNTRYSPAPASISQDTGTRNRYAVPPSGGLPPRVPSISHGNQFQPRTSSPLLHSSSASQLQPVTNTATQSGTTTQSQAASNYAAFPSQSHSQYSAAPALAQPFNPSAIETPGFQQRGSVEANQAPFSSHGPQLQPVPQQRRNAPSYDEGSFIVPTDGTEYDPLRRWQGAPIVRFGFGGSVVTSFPKRVPRFTSNHATPAIKCAAGDIQIHSAKVLPLDEVITSFPGPLKAKNKKKDVLAWLSNGIARLEEELSRGGFAPQSDSSKRRVENLLLWKVLRVLVDCDGQIDSNPAAIPAIRLILTPEVQDAPQDGIPPTYYQTPAVLYKGEQPAPAVVSPGTVEEIRKLLLRGEREKAVWLAVDQKLWGHAMLIASTLPPELWRQVTQDFVKNEVKTAGDNTESLAALYDVFSGNWEESMDQLVPSSTRAGLQMVSKTASSGPTKNSLNGLDRWRETLSMILSNRSAEDVRSLASLGALLLSYGRTEAAHICYLFSRLPGLVSGADDPNATIVLLGENHKANPFNYAQDLYSVLLTEIYEFVTSVLSSNPSPAFGHLQSFKLWHATMLAESGASDQAQQYCDAIASTLKGSTKASPYYHSALFTGVEDLSNRIRSSPRDASGSWISKPSMDKVSGSMWSKFSSFVAGGEDSDAASATSKAGAEGPFAMISGSTPPSLSRGPSPSNHGGLYPGVNGYMPSAARPMSGNSRYAPKGAATSEPSSVNRQPSISSFGSTSPDYQRSHMPQTQGLPAQALSFSPGKDSSYSPHNTVGNVQRPSFSTSQQHSTAASSRAVSDAGLPSPPSGPVRATSSPYEPQAARSASPYEVKPSNYAPRASSYQPRSYQPSPKPAGAEQSEFSYQPTPSATSAPADNRAEDMGSGALLTPQADQEPPTPRASEVPSYGYEPQLYSQQGVEGGPSDEPGSETAHETTSGYQPPAASFAPSSSSYEPPQSSYEPPQSIYEPPQSSYEPPQAGYQPPSSGYEPPSYEPQSGGYEPPTSYEPPSGGYDPPSASEEAHGNGDSAAPKKKGVMDLSDDDDDVVARAAALKKAQRAENDRKAAEAFRMAAEADAARDKSGGKTVAPKGSGWLGGWFSRKGEDGGAGDAPGGVGPDGSKKPIKARLGEENSFYYDAELKKWVNKKGGADAAAPAAPTPPPPKGGPPPGSRAASLGPPMGRPPTSNPSGTPPMGGPTPLAGPPMGGSGPPSRTASPAVAGGEAAGAPPLAPPSRPGTGMSGMSNASSIDDLIGAAGPRRAGGTARRAKKKGYVDVMAK